MSGVAGGLADWLNASPIFVRVVIALLFNFEPVGWAYAGRHRPAAGPRARPSRVGQPHRAGAAGLAVWSAESLDRRGGCQRNALRGASSRIWVPLYGLLFCWA